MKLRSNSSGVVIPLVYYVVLGVGILVGAALPQIRARLGIRDPHAERIVALQQQVQAKDSQIQSLQTTKDGAVTASTNALKGQVADAQQDVRGAKIELQKTNPDLPTVRTLVDRADGTLASVLGDLPQAKQEQIETYINLCLSGQQAQADKILASKDADLKALQAQKAQADALVASTTQQLTAAKVDKATLTEKLNSTTADVVSKEKTLLENAKKLTGFGSYVDMIWFWIKVAGCAYLFIHFIMPSIDDELDKHYPTSPPMWVQMFHSLYNTLKTLTCAH